jgi:hypothetical protein
VTLDLSTADHRILDLFLNTILDGYKSDNLSQMEARSAIAEAVALAASDNGNLTRYMKAKIEKRGKNF